MKKTTYKTFRKVYSPFRSRGFSLIETLIAVVVLVGAIVGPLTLAERSISSAIYARDQVTASFLAEEAIEYARSVRDENELSNKNWLTNLSGSCLGDTGKDKDQNLCMIDATQKPTDAVQACNRKKDLLYESVCDPIAFNTLSGLYGYAQKGENGWVDTRFVREVNIQSIPNVSKTSDHEAVIVVTVRWQTGNFPVRSMVMRDYLYDW